jgi:hypothetical protein
MGIDAKEGQFGFVAIIEKRRNRLRLASSYSFELGPTMERKRILPCLRLRPPSHLGKLAACRNARLPVRPLVCISSAVLKRMFLSATELL